MEENANTVSEDQLLSELATIATGIGRMFPGLCEVVVHDLRNPEHAIYAIENNLSGRSVGQPATELGRLRIADDNAPHIIQNYANTFPDGRTAKSTSIGIKNDEGKYIAALCLNLDTSLLSGITHLLSTLTTTSNDQPSPIESLAPVSSDTLRNVIDAFAAQHSTVPQLLPREEKRRLVEKLYHDGYFDLRDAAQTIAHRLGVSRATVYNYTK